MEHRIVYVLIAIVVPVLAGVVVHLLSLTDKKLQTVTLVFNSVALLIAMVCLIVVITIKTVRTDWWSDVATGVLYACLFAGTLPGALRWLSNRRRE